MSAAEKCKSLFTEHNKIAKWLGGDEAEDLRFFADNLQPRMQFYKSTRKKLAVQRTYRMQMWKMTEKFKRGTGNTES